MYDMAIVNNNVIFVNSLLIMRFTINLIITVAIIIMMHEMTIDVVKISKSRVRKSQHPDNEWKLKTQSFKIHTILQNSIDEPSVGYHKVDWDYQSRWSF